MAAVTVLTAGKHESTHEVGDAIAERLRARGHDATAAAAEDVGRLPGDTDTALVLGSALYMGRWRRPARKLASRLGSEPEGRPFWLFSVGPIGDPPAPEAPPAEQLVGAEAAARARGFRTFSGRLDREQLGRIERMAVDAQEAPDGDFRDWPAIEAWADEIAAELDG